MGSPKHRELDPFQEIIGTFRRFYTKDDLVIVVLRGRQLQIPIRGLSALKSAHLKPGELVSIFRTDNERAPVLVRRLR